MDPWLYLLLLGLVVGFYVAVAMVVLGGLHASELRDRLIAALLDTYTYEGWPIPGRRRGPLVGALLWLLRYDGPDAPRSGTRTPGLPLLS